MQLKIKMESTEPKRTVKVLYPLIISEVRIQAAPKRKSPTKTMDRTRPFIDCSYASLFGGLDMKWIENPAMRVSVPDLVIKKGIVAARHLLTRYLSFGSLFLYTNGFTSPPNFVFCNADFRARKKRNKSPITTKPRLLNISHWKTFISPTL